MTNGVVVTIEKNSDVHFIPVKLVYTLRSKYKTKSRKGKPHDFTISVEVAISTRLPYEIICTDHEYIVRMYKEKTVIRLCNGQGVTINTYISKDAIKRSKKYLYVIANVLYNTLRELGIKLPPRKTAIVWIATDLEYLYVELPEHLKQIYAKLGLPRVICEIEKSEAIETKDKVFQSKEDVRDGIAGVVGDVLGNIVREWFSDPLSQGGYEFDVPVDESIVDDLDEGISIDVSCVLTTANYILSKIDDITVIETETAVQYALFYKGNSYYSEPYYRPDWSDILESYVNSRIHEIIEAIVRWYNEEVLGWWK